MKNFVQSGDKPTLVAPSGGVLSGTPVLIGNLFVVPLTDAAEGEEFAGMAEGIFNLPKKAATAFTVGQLLYWDAGNGVVSDLDGEGVLIGMATAAAAANDTTIESRLSGTPAV